MLKSLATVALALTLAQKTLPVQGENQQNQAQSKTSETRPNTPTIAAVEVDKENAENAERYAYYKTHKKEYLKAALAPANLSNWILSGLGVVGGILALFTLRTFKRQTDHIVTSERAWIVVHIEGERIPPEIQGATGIRWTPFEVRITNKGKTPAYLIESGHRGVILPNNKSLPEIPEPYEDMGVVKAITKWEGEGLPLQPNADILKETLIKFLRFHMPMF